MLCVINCKQHLVYYSSHEAAIFLRQNSSQVLPQQHMAHRHVCILHFLVPLFLGTIFPTLFYYIQRGSIHPVGELGVLGQEKVGQFAHHVEALYHSAI